MEKETYDNMLQCAKATNTPYAILKAAKAHPEKPPGFNYTSGSSRINWQLLKPWIDEHRSELESQLKEGSLETLKKEKLKEEIKGKRLDNMMKEGTYVDPEEWYGWMSEFALELNTKAKALMQSLMEKCPERSKIIYNEFIDYFVTIEQRKKECEPK